jgi:transposase InsO family protein
MVKDAARLLGVVPLTVYRHLAAYGYKSGRKPRADKGRTCVDRDTALLVCGMVHEARRANGKKTLSMTTAVEILEHNGMGCKIDYETGEVTMVSPGTVARVAKVYGCHPEQLRRGKPSIRQRSLHPNHVWQVDASVCTVFYLPSGKVRIFDESRNYKNKPKNLEKTAHERVIRWVVTDHYSGAFFLRYTLGAESAESLLNALIEAMCRRDDSENECLYGAPQILMADKGSAVRSAPAQSLFAALGVEVILHAVGNPRANGQVEQAQNLTETQFEGRLRMYTVGEVESLFEERGGIDVIRDLTDLNAAADKWRIAYNLSRIHSRHKKTRHALWRTIREEQLRIPAGPEVLRDYVYHKPVEITVPHNLTLEKSLKRYGYGSHVYDLRHIPGILPGMKLPLRVNPFRAPCVDVTLTDADGVEHVYILEPLEIDEASGFRLDAPVIGQEYKALADTAVDRAVKDIHLRAHAADTLAAAYKAESGKGRVYGDIDPMADVAAVPLRQYMPRRGRDLTLAPTLKESPPLSLVDAVFALHHKFSGMGLEWTPEDAARVEGWYGNNVPATDMAGLADRLLTARMSAGLKMVAGGAA